MPNYCISKQKDNYGKYKVHKLGTPGGHTQHCVPKQNDPLGEFLNAVEALTAARKIQPDADPCRHCCGEAA